MMKLALSASQLRQLEPYFEAVREGNRAGLKHAVAAQIWPDGMVVKLIGEPEAVALCAALGGDADTFVDSAAHKIGE